MVLTISFINCRLCRVHSWLVLLMTGIAVGETNQVREWYSQEFIKLLSDKPINPGRLQLGQNDVRSVTRFVEFMETSNLGGRVDEMFYL